MNNVTRLLLVQIPFFFLASPAILVGIAVSLAKVGYLMGQELVERLIKYCAKEL